VRVHRKFETKFGWVTIESLAQGKEQSTKLVLEAVTRIAPQASPSSNINKR
jgi:hypothetical protein